MHTTYDPRRLADCFVDFFQCLKAHGHKVGLEKQVLRGIAGQDQFGSKNDFRSLRLQQAARLHNPAGIALQVAHRRVDLSQSDIHHFTRIPIAGLP